MHIIPKATAILACLLSLGSMGVVRLDQSYELRQDQSVAVISLCDLIELPTHLPPRPDPIVLSLAETDIDEEDNDEVENPLAFAPLPSDADAALLCVPRLPLSLEAFNTKPLAVKTVLRC
jgi:hypothetical protein